MSTNNTFLDRDNLINRLDRHLDWIKSCDTKASIVIAGLGLFLTIFTSEQSLKGLGSVLNVAVKDLNFANLLFLLMVTTSFLSILYGGYNLIRVLVPRLKKDTSLLSNIRNDSLYYFETIADRDFTSFRQSISEESESDEVQDLLSQIYINAKICSIKYKYYGKGIQCSFLGISAFIVLYMIGIILLKVGGFE